MEPIWLLALLACPIAMGGMMFVMMRGMRRDEKSSERNEKRD